MSNSRAFLAIGAMLVATFVMGVASPVSASPIGTTFDFVSDNFQGTGGAAGIPFGTPTFVPGSGVVIDSAVSPSPAIPGFLVGGLDFLEFSITTDDLGYLNSSTPDNSSWLFSGINWGPGASPAVATGLIFLSFGTTDIAGSTTWAAVDGTAFGAPAFTPNPGLLNGVTGAASIPIGIGGTDASVIPYDSFALTGGLSIFSTMLLLGITALEALGLNTMQVGYEVIHVPEPASIMMLATGLGSVLCFRRRKNR